MKPGKDGGAPWGSGVSPPPPHALPCPRVSITTWTYPAPAHPRCSWGRPRPAPYPTYSTTAGSRRPVAAGAMSQARTRSPAKPENSRSCTSTSFSADSTRVSVAGWAWRPDSAMVRAQKASKSAGSVTSGR